MVVNRALKAPFKKVSTAALESFAARAGRAASLRGKINILVTTNEELRSLNRYFRNHDAATDVLSFPAFNPSEGAEQFAGDIAISAEIAARQAYKLGHTYDQEIKILMLHGILHLAGYDHENDDGPMAQKEEQLRRALDLPSNLIARALITRAGKGLRKQRIRNQKRR